MQLGLLTLQLAQRRREAAVALLVARHHARQRPDRRLQLAQPATRVVQLLHHLGVRAALHAGGTQGRQLGLRGAASLLGAGHVRPQHRLQLPQL